MINYTSWPIILRTKYKWYSTNDIRVVACMKRSVTDERTVKLKNIYASILLYVGHKNEGFFLTHTFFLYFYMKYSIGHFEILTSLLQKVSRIFYGIHCKKNCVSWQSGWVDPVKKKKMYGWLDNKRYTKLMKSRSYMHVAANTFPFFLHL
jgi:hypothetical protein